MEFDTEDQVLYHLIFFIRTFNFIFEFFIFHPVDKNSKFFVSLLVIDFFWAFQSKFLSGDLFSSQSSQLTLLLHFAEERNFA